MNTSTNANTNFLMPDSDVLVTPNWIVDPNLQYLSITDDGAVSASATLKAMTTSDTHVDLVIPSSINGIKATSIANQGFLGCAAIRSIEIQEGIISIEGNALTFSETASITIPSSVAYISSYAFQGTTAFLTTINIHKPQDSIADAPWGATNATINWLG